jgi:hypothetical protein
MEILQNKVPRTEGHLTKEIETQTSKIPSDVFLWSALGLMTVSLGLQIAGKKHVSQFIGEWPLALLIMGLYNKLVKVAGHEQKHWQRKTAHA